MCAAIGGLENATFPKSRCSTIKNVGIRRIDSHRENRSPFESVIGSLPRGASVRVPKNGTDGAGIESLGVGRIKNYAPNVKNFEPSIYLRPVIPAVRRFEDSRPICARIYDQWIGRIYNHAG